jgi:hypothetical protein
VTGVAGEEQHGALVLFEALPEIVRIGLGNSAALAVLPRRDRRKFISSASEDVAVMFLQVSVFAWAEPFLLRLATRAQVCCSRRHVLRPGITLGLHDEGQLAQQMRPAQAMATVYIGEIGRPAVMDNDPLRSGGSPRWPPSLPARASRARTSR